jgi:hypothetical protein
MSRVGHKVWALQLQIGRRKEMKCDICHEEFANSEEVKVHKEREHPMGKQQDDDLVEPDAIGKSSESDPSEPAPVVRPVR